ncbi:DUF354 domain-containing protein [Salinirubrum litoreum]|uniref:DUF354 domain-containing protein n=1 Tax=Salinirubrum litoreum TaxID=1126234 RepID=A0ABD5RG45_9EURY
MRVLVTIQHPGHVHFFRNAIAEWRAEGHAVHVCVREKSVATALLDAYDVEHTVLAGATDGFLDLAVTQLVWEAKLLGEARRFDPDVLVAIAEPGVTHVAPLVGAESLLFVDTEHGTLQNRLAFPFADRICVPDCYFGDLPATAVRYPGYHELAYLHPNRFTPDPEILRAHGVDPDERLIVLRTVAWGAAHDFGQSGLGGIEAVVEELEASGGRVVVSAEADVPESLADRRYDVPPEHMHHLLAHAELFVGESATMAAESAVLGTPAVYISNWELGYTRDLERYGLLFSFVDEDRETRQREGLAVAREILTGGEPPVPATDDVLASTGESWAERRARLLAEKVDTTQVIHEQVADLAGVGEQAGEPTRDVRSEGTVGGGRP